MWFFLLWHYYIARLGFLHLSLEDNTTPVYSAGTHNSPTCIVVNRKFSSDREKQSHLQKELFYRGLLAKI